MLYPVKQFLLFARTDLQHGKKLHDRRFKQGFQRLEDFIGWHERRVSILIDDGFFFVQQETVVVNEHNGIAHWGNHLFPHPQGFCLFRIGIVFLKQIIYFLGIVFRNRMLYDLFQTVIIQFPFDNLIITTHGCKNSHFSG